MHYDYIFTLQLWVHASWSIKVSNAAPKFATSVLRTIRVVIQPESSGWGQWIQGTFLRLSIYVVYLFIHLFLTLKVLNFWKFTTCCSLRPLWSGMGEVVPARISPTLHPPSPPTASIIVTGTLRINLTPNSCQCSLLLHYMASRVRFWAVQNLFFCRTVPKTRLTSAFYCPKLSKTAQNHPKLSETANWLRMCQIDTWTDIKSVKFKVSNAYTM